VRLIKLLNNIAIGTTGDKSHHHSVFMLGKLLSRAQFIGWMPNPVEAARLYIRQAQLFKYNTARMFRKHAKEKEMSRQRTTATESHLTTGNDRFPHTREHGIIMSGDNQLIQRGRVIMAKIGETLVANDAAIFIPDGAQLWIDGKHVATVFHTDNGCGHEFELEKPQ
jgi:hypothetical protein